MEWLQSHVISIGLTSGIFLVLGIALKKIPTLLETKVQAAIDKLFDKGDAADDQFLIAAITWAEAKYGPGSGEVKAKFCVDKILSLLPIAYRPFVTEKSRLRAIQLFQESFDRLEKIAINVEKLGQ